MLREILQEVVLSALSSLRGEIKNIIIKYENIPSQEGPMYVLGEENPTKVRVILAKRGKKGLARVEW